MAKAPASSPNHATRMVTIFNSEGEELVVSRLNAMDLIRDGGYFWKAEDVNKPRSEDAGPVNPKAKTQTVYGEDGTAYELDSANARDMINTGKYFWNDPTAGTSEAADAATDEDKTADDNSTVVTEPAPETDAEPESPTEPESTPAPTADPDIDPVKEPLVAQALRVTGSDDVIVYLEGFADQALRDMAMERYGEKLHHRASKATVIEKIVALEDARTVGDDQADA